MNNTAEAVRSPDLELPPGTSLGEAVNAHILFSQARPNPPVDAKLLWLLTEGSFYARDGKVFLKATKNTKPEDDNLAYKQMEAALTVLRQMQLTTEDILNMMDGKAEFPEVAVDEE